ncbi:anhydro-N-acetylmuramic acid kinase [Trichoderma gamsii]|uniref:Anhydro-N-acetylmuramic acid kinase n=1 Tax=Trichoderma gamsii TaxID=398673 RepID=A0A2P5A095_9HYPO|nr:anhydro-N-acetylmuramic acid kinase [Trichoderma gamsii]PON29969.1 anhydro-N-acetylmuramic acid kinase [Trichoderma gamsii]
MGSIINTDPELDLVVLGLSSGISMESIEFALCRFRQQNPAQPVRLELLKYGETLLDPGIEKRLTDMISDDFNSPEQVAQVNDILGEAFAEAALQFIATNDIDKSTIDIISCRAQAAWRIPYPAVHQTRTSLRLNEGTVIASRTGITTVTDFRVGEAVVGPQGAPSDFDALLLHHPTKLRACQNISGIGNVCFIPPDISGELNNGFINFDTGPGNIYIDAAIRHYTNGAQRYDVDGEIGKRGEVDEEIVDDFISSHPYFQRSIPKSAGRDDFRASLAYELISKAEDKGLSPEDVVATITRITAQSIVDHYKCFAPSQNIDELFLCGGSAYNPNIVNFIQKNYASTKIYTLDVAGIPAVAREAITLALQGMNTVVSRTVRTSHGAETRQQLIAGKISPGDNYGQVMQKVVQFGNGETLEPIRDLVNVVNGEEIHNKW